MDSDKILKIYGDYASQPSRAVLCLLKMNKIPFEFIETRVGKMEHHNPEFIKINPWKAVPALVEVDKKTGEEWALFESHAILRYICTTRKLADHWYPADIVK